MPGLGQGRSFTELAWARAQFIEKLDINPYPGTLNLLLEQPEDLRSVAVLRSQAGIEIVPESPQFCSAKCFPVLLEGKLAGAIVFPEVDGYPPDKLEIISAVRVKTQLQIEDGDTVTVSLARDFATVPSQ